MPDPNGRLSDRGRSTEESGLTSIESCQSGGLTRNLPISPPPPWQPRLRQISVKFRRESRRDEAFRPRFGVAGVCADGHLVGGDGLVGAVLLVEGGTEVAVGGVVGGERDDLAVEVLGMGEVAGVVLADGRSEHFFDVDYGAGEPGGGELVFPHVRLFDRLPIDRANLAVGGKLEDGRASTSSAATAGAARPAVGPMTSQPPKPREPLRFRFAFALPARHRLT